MSTPSHQQERYVAGDLIGGKYELDRMVAEGGMGAVWAATQAEIGLSVAVKIVHQHLQVPNVSSRLKREAQVAARVQHPGLVKVFDFGTTTLGDSYLVLEWLDGESLADRLAERGPLDPEAAAQVFLALTSALEALHQAGIVHRDVKPDNILLTRDSSGQLQPKLVDFGIATTPNFSSRLSSPPGARDSLVAPPEEPESGIFGTPGYLAPEQALDEPTDDRTDSWGTAVSLLEAMTNEALFDGDGIQSVLAVRASGLCPDLVGQYPDLPPDLLAMIEQCLSPIALERKGIRQLRRALAQWLQNQGVETDISGVSLAHHRKQLGDEQDTDGDARLKPKGRASSRPDADAKIAVADDASAPIPVARIIPLGKLDAPEDGAPADTAAVASTNGADANAAESSSVVAPVLAASALNVPFDLTRRARTTGHTPAPSSHTLAPPAPSRRQSARWQWPLVVSGAVAAAFGALALKNQLEPSGEPVGPAVARESPSADVPENVSESAGAGKSDPNKAKSDMRSSSNELTPDEANAANESAASKSNASRAKLSEAKSEAKHPLPDPARMAAGHDQGANKPVVAAAEGSSQPGVASKQTSGSKGDELVDLAKAKTAAAEDPKPAEPAPPAPPSEEAQVGSDDSDHHNPSEI